MTRPIQKISIDDIINKYLATNTLRSFVEIQWHDKTGAQTRPTVHKLVSTRKTSPTNHRMLPAIEIEYRYPSSGVIADDFDATPVYNLLGDMVKNGVIVTSIRTGDLGTDVRTGGQDPILDQNLILSSAIAKRCPLTSLSFDYCSQRDNDILIAENTLSGLAKNGSLNELQITSIKDNFAENSALIKFIKTIPNLKTLLLQEVGMVNVDQNFFSELHLEELYFLQNNSGTARDAEKTLGSLLASDCENLRVFHITFSHSHNLTNERQLKELFSKCHNLKEVSVGSIFNDYRSGKLDEAIIALAKNNPDLRKVTFPIHFFINAEQLDATLDALKKYCPKLEELSLYNNTIDGSCGEGLTRLVHNCKSLQTLVLPNGRELYNRNEILKKFPTDIVTNTSPDHNQPSTNPETKNNKRGTDDAPNQDQSHKLQKTTDNSRN